MYALVYFIRVGVFYVRVYRNALFMCRKTTLVLRLLLCIHHIRISERVRYTFSL